MRGCLKWEGSRKWEGGETIEKGDDEWGKGRQG